MAKFNRAEPFGVHEARTEALAASSPVVKTAAVATAVNHQGGAGYVREFRSELFLLAIANMVGETTFYEPAADRDARYEQLVRQAAVVDPVWTAQFLEWLRGRGNMRTAAIVGAAHYVHARITDGPAYTGPVADQVVEGTDSLSYSIAANRRVVASVLQRADEPGELLAYWLKRYGRAIPKPVKRGIGDAVQAMYSERNLLKYDTDSHAIRFGDVLELTHPSAHGDKPWQGDLFAYALSRRRRPTVIPASLTMLRHNAQLRLVAAENPDMLLNSHNLEQAGMTWEDVLSLAGDRLPKAKVWEAIAPSMGYMALLRNLRNFDEAGMSDAAAAAIAAKLADPAEVAKSRQLPMRFLSAYRAVSNLRWAWPLEQALSHSLDNIPALPGRTLILVDTSGSMNMGFSKDGTLMRWDAAVLFGVALAQRCSDADVVSFSTGTRVFPLQGGESLLKSLDRWKSGGYFFGGGTNTAQSIRTHFAGHDRIVVLTDEQAAAGSVNLAVPASTPLITFNLAGYQHGHAPSGTATRVTVGGLTDAGFAMIPLIGAERGDRWPWER